MLRKKKERGEHPKIFEKIFENCIFNNRYRIQKSVLKIFNLGTSNAYRQSFSK